MAVTFHSDSTNDINIEEGATLDVSGGSQAGNGGNIDIVTPATLNFSGTLNGFAATGYNPGTANLDPTNINVGCTPVSGTCAGATFGISTTVWATDDVSIVGNVTITGGSTLNLFADNLTGVAGAFGGSTGGIIETGNFTINGGGTGILNLEAGSDGIGSIGSSGALLVKGLASISAIIDPSAAGGDIAISNSGATALTISLAPTSTFGISTLGNVYLTSAAGGIAQTGTAPITANTLTVTDTTGATTLNNPSNAIQNLGVITAGTKAVSLTDSVAVTQTGAIAAGSLALTDSTGITLNNSGVTTSGTQTYAGPVTLGATTTLTGSTITFNSTVDGNDTLDITGNAAFNSAVGGEESLSSLYISGTTLIKPGVTNIITSGNQEYNGAVTLATSTSLNAGAGSSTVTFDSTLNGAHALIITVMLILTGSWAVLHH